VKGLSIVWAIREGLVDRGAIGSDLLRLARGSGPQKQARQLPKGW
jgi:hypothetical protein